MEKIAPGKPPEKPSLTININKSVDFILLLAGKVSQSNITSCTCVCVCARVCVRVRVSHKLSNSIPKNNITKETSHCILRTFILCMTYILLLLARYKISHPRILSHVNLELIVCKSIYVWNEYIKYILR